jgi:hypothetical protein
VLEASPEERERAFNAMWDQGGFSFWLANYQDMFFNKEANEVCADPLWAGSAYVTDTGLQVPRALLLSCPECAEGANRE